MGLSSLELPPLPPPGDGARSCSHVAAFCLIRICSRRVMVWNCSQQSDTVDLVAPSEIEINWLRECAEQQLVNLTQGTVGPHG